jgi:hypothetical protein
MYKQLLTATVLALACTGCVASIGNKGAEKCCGTCKTTKKVEEKAVKSEIAVTATPPVVLAAFGKEFPGAKIDEVEKEVYPNGIVHYEIEYTDAAGKKADVEISSEGDVLDEHD